MGHEEEQGNAKTRSGYGWSWAWRWDLNSESRQLDLELNDCVASDCSDDEQIDGEREQIASELHDAWVRKLHVWWDHYNEVYLGGMLARPVIVLSDSGHTLGFWDRSRRSIAISAAHIVSHAWEDVLDTLRHEMAHQYVDDVLHPDGEAAHGPAFREACDRLRCSPRASAEPGSLQDQDDRTLRLVRKLLSLADSPNEHEAQLAVQKARRLLVKYNIDLVNLDAERRFESRIVGEVKGRHTSAEIWLSAILNRFFFVEAIWSQSYDAVRNREGTRLQIYGTSQNLDMAEFVHAYLTGLMPQLWDTYREREGISGNRERQRYYTGVLEGFHTKLTEQERSLERDHALAWKGDAALKSYYRHINPNIHTRFGGGGRRNEVYDAGVEEGRNVNIHQPVREKGAGTRGLLN